MPGFVGQKISVIFDVCPFFSKKRKLYGETKQETLKRFLFFTIFFWAQKVV